MASRVEQAMCGAAPHRLHAAGHAVALPNKDGIVHGHGVPSRNGNFTMSNAYCWTVIGYHLSWRNS